MCILQDGDCGKKGKGVRLHFEPQELLEGKLAQLHDIVQQNEELEGEVVVAHSKLVMLVWATCSLLHLKMHLNPLHTPNNCSESY